MYNFQARILPVDTCMVLRLTIVIWRETKVDNTRQQKTSKDKYWVPVKVYNHLGTEYHFAVGQPAKRSTTHIGNWNIPSEVYLLKPRLLAPGSTSRIIVMYFQTVMVKGGILGKELFRSSRQAVLPSVCRQLPHKQTITEAGLGTSLISPVATVQ